MENQNNLKNKIVETYVADMSRVVDGHEGIYIKKMIQDDEDQNENDENDFFSSKDLRIKIFVFLGLFLIFTAVGVLGFLIFSKKNSSVVEVSLGNTPFIYLDDSSSKEIAGLSKEQIFKSLTNEISNKEIKKDGVLGIYLFADKNAVGLRKFLTLISANIDQKKMTFISDNFLIGVANIEKKDPFILIKGRSFTDIFEVVNLWENKMFYDLHDLFDIEISSDTNYLNTKSFEDIIVQNKNARILRDNEGKIVMMYVFINDTSLLITNSELASKEIGLRLSSGILRK